MPTLRAILSLSFAALLWGCSDDQTAQPDGGPRADGGIGADGGARPDGGRPDGGFVWPLPTSSVAITPSDEWKNRITPDDPFVRPAERDQLGRATAPRWVKFSVLIRDPSRVYFQDSNVHPFHYDFVSRRLDPFVGDTRAEIDQVTLHEAGQELVLGAVLFPPDEGVEEYGVQLVRQDAYHPEMARIILELVERSVTTSTSARAFYFPTFEQDASARQNAAFFEASGFPLGSPDRWGTSSCYASGWALGRLVYVPSDRIDLEYAAGRLTAEDVLLTDGIPAEVPFVAGILSTVPATPNSHVAILARTYQVPFGQIRSPEEQDRVRALSGREVAVRVDDRFGACTVRVTDAEGKLTPAQRSGILALKGPLRLDYPAKQRRNAYSAHTDDLGPADARSFGGKVANFALLRDAIPEASPSAVALSFDLFDDFMAQRLGDGRTLQETIRARLAAFQPPVEVAALKAELAAIRTIIREQATFPQPLQAAVLQAVSVFPANERIRFRSSTNVEDGAEFTGAGLYDSISGCVADDTDADMVGPSACDATKDEERGVFRAIQKVYASFYNDNAYLERLRRGVDEDEVAMGLLVHPSYVDENELANGVVTLDWNANSQRLLMVTQAGAVSVTNPEGSARPESVQIEVFGTNIYPSINERSTLVQLGATVLELPGEYEAFTRLFLRVGQKFAQVSGRDSFTLDMEYKKVRPNVLVVKQVREVPRPDTTRAIPAFLLGDTARRCTFQGESGDVWGNHRLKSRLTLPVRSSWLDDASLAQTLFGDVVHERLDGARVVTTSGALAQRPGFAHRFDDSAITDGWAIDGTNPATVELATSVARSVTAPAIPILTLEDAQLTLTARWSTPVFELSFDGMPATRTDDYTPLGACPEDNVIGPSAMPVERDVAVNGKRARVSFYWPPPPTGITAGYTAPLLRWRETVLEGFTAQPIVLRGYWSQTYRPGHHNFSEEFLFEPRLEEGLPQAVKDELEAAGVRMIHVMYGKPEGGIGIVGTDGTYRRER